MEWTAETLLALVRESASHPQAFGLETMRRMLDRGQILQTPARAYVVARSQKMAQILLPLSAPIYAFDHDNKPMGVFEAGRLLGLPQALRGTTLPFSLKTNHTTDILFIPFADIRSLIDHDATMRWQVIDFLAHLSTENLEAAPAIIHSDPAIRLAQTLLDLCEKYGEEEEDGIKIQGKFSQEELGARIGTSRQTVNKYVQEFIDREYIAKAGHRYKVLSKDALKNFIKTR